MKKISRRKFIIGASISIAGLGVFALPGYAAMSRKAKDKVDKNLRTPDKAYIRIGKTIYAQDPLTAPTDEKGSIHWAFVEHLKLLYSPKEAEIVQHLNCLPFGTPTAKLAGASGKPLAEVEKIVTGLADRAAVVGMGAMYCIPPVDFLINYHMTYSDIRPGDLEAARLYQEFFITGGFFKYFESSQKGTAMVRTIPIMKNIAVGEKVLPAEEFHDFLLNHSSEHLALAPCPCRTRTEKLGIRECKDKLPVGACILMGNMAHALVGSGSGKYITRAQAIDFFNKMHKLGIVGTTQNTAYGDFVICHCCGCCCSMTRGRIKWGNPDAVAPSNFIPKAADDCVGCGTCAEECFFSAPMVDEETDKMTLPDPDKCVGCGMCTMVCPQESLKLVRLDRHQLTHKNNMELKKAMFHENREG